MAIYIFPCSKYIFYCWHLLSHESLPVLYYPNGDAVGNAGFVRPYKQHD